MKPSPRKVIGKALIYDARREGYGGTFGLMWTDLQPLTPEGIAPTADAILAALERAGYEITEIVRYDDWEAKSFREVHDPPGAS